MTDNDNVIMTVIKKRFDGDYSDVGMRFMCVNEKCHFALSTCCSFINISVNKTPHIHEQKSFKRLEVFQPDLNKSYSFRFFNV